MEYDFSGWATKNNIKCSDGRTIIKDAFKQNDGQKVPLVWNHQHDDPNEVLGHAILENREEGVYAYCKFNDTDSGKQAKALVHNGDIVNLSIYANKLKSQMNNVIHGCIREVSLVLAGANPGAFIDSVISHSDSGDEEEEATIYTDEDITLAVEEAMKEDPEDDDSSDDEDPEKSDELIDDSKEPSKEKEPDDGKEDDKPSEENPESDANVEHADKDKDILAGIDDGDKDVIYAVIAVVKDNGTVDPKNVKFKEVFDKLDEDKQETVYALIGKAVEDFKSKNKKEEGENTKMKHNVFDKDTKDDTLVHSAIVGDAIADAKRFGSMKASFIEHAAANNIENIDYLFPEAKELNTPPKMIKENEEWVGVIMKNVKRTPFSRVKTSFARMDENTARAKGYIKGNKKVDLAMSILKRVTTPTTVYIKNTIDRDDLVDITDFDVIAWQKGEMRSQLDKELALAMLLGDGRNVSDDNKINELNIRPIVSDDDMYTIKYVVTEGRDYKSTANSVSDNDSETKGIIRAAIKSRKNYKGSGRPVFFTTEDYLTDMLLIEDQNGRIIYDSVEKLATALRVSQIVTVPEMEARTDIYGIIINFNDYTAGADKGGAIGMFDDFDIDYNQMKYLMETRMSGAITTPYSAIVLKKEVTTEGGEETQG